MAAAVFSSNRQNINKWWFFLGLLRGLRRWRSRPTTFERTQQWTRSMVLEKTKKHYVLPSKSKREKNSKERRRRDSFSSSMKAFFWLRRKRWGQMHIDDICGPLTNRSSSSLRASLRTPISASLVLQFYYFHTTIIVLRHKRALCWAKQDQDRIIHDEGYPPLWYVCVRQSDLDFPKTISEAAFLFTKKSEMMPN